MPLERLTDIDWSQHHHAYGPASDVPALILELLSEEESTRREAHETLCQTIWHQGTVYEATAYAVPFLIELLTLPHVKDKDGVLYMLQMLAHGSSYLDVHQSLNSYYHLRHSEGFQADLREELQWVAAAHDAVEQGIPQYLALLAGEATDCAVMVPYTLAICYKNAETLLPTLRAVLLKEERQVVRVSLICGVGELLKRYSQVGGTFASEDMRLLETLAANRHESPHARLAASLALVELLGTSATTQALLRFAELGAACSAKLSVSLPWAIGDGSVRAMSLALEPYPHLHLPWILDTLDHPEFADTETRTYLLWKIHDASRASRQVARDAVAPLMRLLRDADLEVATRAGQRLAELGTPKAIAEAELVRWATDEDDALSVLATDVLARFRKIEQQADQEVTRYLRTECTPPVTLPGTLQPPLFKALVAALVCFDRHGGVTDADRPLLRQYLQNEWPIIRVLAARLLWVLGEAPATLVPVLTYNLHPDESGFLALEALGRMRTAASAAVPLLTDIVASDHRWHWAASANTWNELDDRFAERAQQVLHLIDSEA